MKKKKLIVLRLNQMKLKIKYNKLKHKLYKMNKNYKFRISNNINGIKALMKIIYK